VAVVLQGFAAVRMIAIRVLAVALDEAVVSRRTELEAVINQRTMLPRIMPVLGHAVDLIVGAEPTLTGHETAVNRIAGADVVETEPRAVVDRLQEEIATMILIIVEAAALNRKVSVGARGQNLNRPCGQEGVEVVVAVPVPGEEEGDDQEAEVASCLVLIRLRSRRTLWSSAKGCA